MGKDDKIRAWYTENLSLLERFSKSMEELVRNILDSQGLRYLNISARVKKLNSVLDKIDRKKYSDPTKEIYDFVALRVVTYLESDVHQVNKIIEDNFILDGDNSIDKSSTLGVDRVGYRSWHYVCKIDDNRSKLAENIQYDGMKFEIQVRTALQHAWAEIEHDRRYKFSGQLPHSESRRFNLLAANLELLDAQFDDLAKKIDEYSKKVEDQAAVGNLEEEVNSVSVSSYLKFLSDKYPYIKLSKKYGTISPEFIHEMKSMGIGNLDDLNEYFSPEFIDHIKSNDERYRMAGDMTAVGIMRDAMMYRDINKYFLEAWQGKWQTMEDWEYDFWSSRYGKEYIDKIFKDIGFRANLHDREIEEEDAD